MAASLRFEALDLVISEHEKNRLAAEANERFVKSGIAAKDVYGTLERRRRPFVVGLRGAD